MSDEDDLPTNMPQLLKQLSVEAAEGSISVREKVALKQALANIAIEKYEVKYYEPSLSTKRSGEPEELRRRERLITHIHNLRDEKIISGDRALKALSVLDSNDDSVLVMIAEELPVQSLGQVLGRAQTSPSNNIRPGTVQVQDGMVRWACPRCTFLNVLTRVSLKQRHGKGVCEICLFSELIDGDEVSNALDILQGKEQHEHMVRDLTDLLPAGDDVESEEETDTKTTGTEPPQVTGDSGQTPSTKDSLAQEVESKHQQDTDRDAKSRAKYDVAFALCTLGIATPSLAAEENKSGVSGDFSNFGHQAAMHVLKTSDKEASQEEKFLQEQRILMQQGNGDEDGSDSKEEITERKGIDRLSATELGNVFSFLTVSDLLSCIPVCRKWSFVAQSNRVWFDMYVQVAGASGLYVPQNARREDLNYRQLCLQIVMEQRKWSTKPAGGSFNMSVMARFKPYNPHAGRSRDTQGRLTNKKDQEEKYEARPGQKAIQMTPQEKRRRIRELKEQLTSLERRKLSGAIKPSRYQILKSRAERELQEVNNDCKTRGTITFISRDTGMVRAQAEDTNLQSKFIFNAAFPPGVRQRDIYREVADRTTRVFCNGYDVCMFMYGQTGSGKTHTMMGPPGVRRVMQNGGVDDNTFGLIPRACLHILEYIRRQHNNTKFTINCTMSVSMVEVYQEEVYDLLGGGDVCRLIETNTAKPRTRRGKERARARGRVAKFTATATTRDIVTLQDVLEALNVGESARHQAATAMNERSSRSHCVFTVRLTQVNRNLDMTINSEFHMVDLAGSERIKKTKTKGKSLEEAKHINQSLSTLGRCLRVLIEQSEAKEKRRKRRTKGKPVGKKKVSEFVPYRDSALTMLLSNSLGGNCKTTMICTAALDPRHYEESISTLRFAHAAMAIKTTLKAERKTTAVIVNDLYDSFRGQLMQVRAAEANGLSGLEVEVKRRAMCATRRQYTFLNLAEELRKRRLELRQQVGRNYICYWPRRMGGEMPLVDFVELFGEFCEGRRSRPNKDDWLQAEDAAQEFAIKKEGRRTLPASAFIKVYEYTYSGPDRCRAAVGGGTFGQLVSFFDQSKLGLLRTMRIRLDITTMHYSSGVRVGEISFEFNFVQG